MKISVIVPVYKTKKLFLENLKHNYLYFKELEIIIIDDASQDKLSETIKKQYKEIKIITNKKNLGFAESVNKGIKAANGDFILLLNSDVKIRKIDFKRLINKFKEDKSLFAISFLQQEKDGSLLGKNKIFFKRGIVIHSKADNLNEGITAWAEGGSCIIRKNYFDDIGGFDEIYAPFYWEDIDLSYRAFKRGWSILFDPETKVLHYHESTIGKYYDKNFIKIVSYRNQFIFIWKIITEKKKIILHLFFLPSLLILSFLQGEIAPLKGLYEALKKLSKIISKKKIQKRSYMTSDSQIFQMMDKI